MTGQDRHISVSGGSVGGNINTGDNVRQGNVTTTQEATAKQDLLAALAELRGLLAEANLTDAASRVDDLEEEARAEEVDAKGGQKAFARLKTALAAVASVTSTLATIEGHVRELFT